MIRKIDSNKFSLTILKVTTFSRIRHGKFSSSRLKDKHLGDLEHFKQKHLGVLEHFKQKHLGDLEHFNKKHLGDLELICIFALKISKL